MIFWRLFFHYYIFTIEKIIKELDKSCFPVSDLILILIVSKQLHCIFIHLIDSLLDYGMPYFYLHLDIHSFMSFCFGKPYFYQFALFINKLIMFLIYLCSETQPVISLSRHLISNHPNCFDIVSIKFFLSRLWLIYYFKIPLETVINECTQICSLPLPFNSSTSSLTLSIRSLFP